MGGALIGRDGGSLGLDHLLDLLLHRHERLTEEGRLRVLRGAPEPGYVRCPGLVPVALLLQEAVLDVFLDSEIQRVQIGGVGRHLHRADVQRTLRLLARLPRHDSFNICFSQGGKLRLTLRSSKERLRGTAIHRSSSGCSESCPLEGAATTYTSVRLPALLLKPVGSLSS